MTEENADLVLEDAYEAIREMIDAFLVKKGFKSYSHEASIAYAQENLDISEAEASKLDKFRKLRNDSKYRGEDVKKSEGQDCLQTAKKLIPRLEDEL